MKKTEEKADEEEEEEAKGEQKDGWKTNGTDAKEEEEDTQGREVVDTDSDEGTASSDHEPPLLESSHGDNLNKLRCVLDIYGRNPHSKSLS